MPAGYPTAAWSTAIAFRTASRSRSASALPWLWSLPTTCLISARRPPSPLRAVCVVRLAVVPLPWTLTWGGAS
jgi:hypothetical protein